VRVIERDLQTAIGVMPTFI